MRSLLVALAATLVLLAPHAAAGTAEAPEVTDPAGDCALAPGNEYADVVSAWISDETSESFVVNIALAKWTEALGSFAGFALQFEHQGVTFGAFALYAGPSQGWFYGNGYIDFASGDVEDATDAEGSFTPGTPAVISITFAKSKFPHGDMADNQLRSFAGGSADFKLMAPWFLQDMPAPPPDQAFQLCDLADGGGATYTFQSGQHSMGDAPAAGNATADAEGNATAPAGAPAVDAVETAAAGEDKGTPAPGVSLLALAALAAAFARRRS